MTGLRTTLRSPKETEWQRRKRRDRERDEHGDTCDIPGCGAATGQRGLCGAVRKRALNEDHDHRTNLHRGWICDRANKALWGWVTPAWLRAAADYLERTL